MSIFVHTQGERSKPALLLLHSGGMTHQEWQPQFDAFAEKFFVVAPDLPGHGQSRLHDDEPVSIANFSAQIVAVLAREGIEKTHVVGSSTGGAIALYMALHYAQVVDKLIIYRMGYQKDANAYEETQRIASPEYWESYGMARWMSKQHLGQTDDEKAAPEMWKKVIARVAALFHPDTTNHVHTLDDLRRLEAETMVIAGDRDPLIPVSTALDMTTAISKSAMWILPNASHVTATNTWRARCFTDEVIRFLEK